MSNPKKIRVIVVDDQALVLRGICGLLALTPDIEVTGSAADGEQALAAITLGRPDVVLLDIRMPVVTGIEVLKRLKEEGALPPTILLTTFDDDEALLEGMRAGAKGFLLKDISLDRLADAIRRVAAGGTMFRPAITERIERGVQALSSATGVTADADPLTARESEILRLMAAGLNNREIARALGPSEGTVKNHVSSILSKLGVRDRVRAVLKGLEIGYI